MIERQRDVGGKVSVEQAFHIGSKGIASAKALADAVREHWGIENGLLHFHINNGIILLSQCKGVEMGRKASGAEVLEKAQVCLSKARTIDELRQAQAVVLPLEFGFSMEQTARAIGVSAGWACQLRTRFVRQGGLLESDRARKGGRHRENLSQEEEAAFLAPFFEKAKAGGILVVGEIKQALDTRLGRTVALSSAYNLLHRHDWRKLAPDKRHPKVDVLAQEDWKKNSPTSLRESTTNGKARGRSG